MIMSKQYGGEGKSDYKGNKSDMSMKQHGGEGKGLGKSGASASLNTGMTGAKYCGPGRSLGK